MKIAKRICQSYQPTAINKNNRYHTPLRYRLTKISLSLLSLGVSSLAVAEETINTVADLDTVEVTLVVQEKGDGMVHGVAASRTTTGTGTDTPIEEVPQSVSVVGSKEINKIGATDVKQALSYTAGVSPENTKDTTSERVYIRGFDSNGESLTNGRKQKSNLWDGTTETYGLERVEVLKGPATILYGSGSAGGVVNHVTKKPHFTDFAETKVTVGDPKHLSVGADVNKQVNDDLAVRVIGMYKNADTTTKDVPNDRMYTSASAKWVASPASLVNARVEYQQDTTAYPWGLPVKGTLQRGKWGAIKHNTYVGNPKTDHYTKNQFSASVDVDHQLTKKTELKQGISYFSNDIDFDYMFTNGSNIDERLYEVNRIERDDTSKTLATNAKISHDWQSKNINNKTLVGVDFSHINYTTDGLQSLATTDKNAKQHIDIYHPDYAKIGRFNMIPAQWSMDNNIRSIGVLAQNQMKVKDRWVGTYGMRYDKLKASSDFINLRNTPALYDDLTTEIDVNNVSTRAGLVYLADKSISPYLSYSESFQPSLYTSDEGLLKPMYGKLMEAGVRYAPKNSDTLLTASVYKVSEENSPIPKPASLFYTQIPKIDAVGVELEAKTSVGKNASLVASYSYNDTKITDIGDIDFFDKGNPKPYTPKHTASVFATSNLSAINTPELEVGLGAKYVGKATTNYPQMRPDHVVVDGVAHYKKDDWKLSLNVNNLLNNQYIDKCSTHCFYGPSREVRGSVTHYR